MSDVAWSLVVRRLAATLRQPVVLAIAVAAAVTLLLLVAVLAAWTAGSDPAQGEPTALAAVLLTPTAAGPSGPTPTPRVIATRPAPSPTPTPTNAPAAADETGASIAPAPEPTAPSATEAPVPPVAPQPTDPPAPTAPPRPTATPKPSPTPTPEALYAAEGADFAAWAAGSWTVAEGQLRNDVAPTLPEPWIVVPYEPKGEAYAVEAEIRVKERLPNYCNQNFGIVAGAARGGPIWGAGVLYPCGAGTAGEPSRARLADLADWRNGYYLARELAAQDFDPGDGWHTYRLEVRGTDLRLLVDGEEVVAAGDDRAARPAGSAQVGFWSEGVRLSIRRVAILPLTSGDA